MLELLQASGVHLQRAINSQKVNSSRNLVHYLAYPNFTIHTLFIYFRYAGMKILGNNHKLKYFYNFSCTWMLLCGELISQTIYRAF